MSAAFVIVGGGIAGVTCAETLSALCSDVKIILLAASGLIKTVVNFQQVSRTLESFQVEERPKTSLEEHCPNVEVVEKIVLSLNSEKNKIICSDGSEVVYKKLCICTGGRPKLIPGNNERVLGIRDVQSVVEFQKMLSNAKRLLVVGNGGIATELVHEIQGCEVIWAIKDSYITSTFVDAGAAQFFLPHLNNEKTTENLPSKRLKYVVDKDAKNSNAPVLGGALGPDWATSHEMSGSEKGPRSVFVEHCVEVKKVLTPEEFKKSQLKDVTPPGFRTAPPLPQETWPVYVELTNGTVYGCDFIVSATGIIPNSEIFLKGNKFDTSTDGYLNVNSRMETSVTDVYAAGDICSATWEWAPQWQQMHLWTQARQMGCYAAKCMAAALKVEEVQMDFCFELFAHVTVFFNFKVVLLGKFNAQGLGDDYEMLLRVTIGEEYVKAVLQDGRLVGAILIGETNLEETFENLILNAMDLTPFKEHLLNPNIDIEDFFD
ncbi:pyridine nucleotide-disulfide oxidoreductase domain-containing protein 1-like [Gigantopelta aegis]|uniref:pyridine nucleotide-disulfide oxidoreductase domain-containing protein 1-like n=1 Tax=Gigantopelta aegis TaxID=1735272 RepID=UPI001B88C17C|nr:pyridine nucleotide-disulfide oxidoreductase domain-containing protein 1-like [Gigantopelta aegis]